MRESEKQKCIGITDLLNHHLPDVMLWLRFGKEFTHKIAIFAYNIYNY